MSPTTRRAHKKSRLGCHQCKKNRTKCDEKRPSCSRCVRIGAICSLRDTTSALIIIDSNNDSGAKGRQPPKQTVTKPSVASNPTSISESPVPANISSESANINSLPVSVPVSCSEDSVKSPGHEHTKAGNPRDDGQIRDSELQRLRLMHHYSQSTSHSIINLTTGSKEGQSIWHEKVPELAFRNDYLLHCLLGVTSLHLALENPSLQHHYGILAIEHYSRGLELYTSHLSAITADNIDALFAFACLTALYSFGIHLRGRMQLSPLVKIHEVFTMLKGNNLLVSTGEVWLKSGIWSPWFRDGHEKVAPKLSDEIEEVINLLLGRINSTITTSTQGKMYFETIQALRENFEQANLRPRTQMALVTLPVMSPPEFITMICIGEPLALCILANWAVVLHWLRGHIWLRNWGVQTVKAVREVLPPEWQNCIAWAMTEVGEARGLPALPTLNTEPNGINIATDSNGS